MERTQFVENKIKKVLKFSKINTFDHKNVVFQTCFFYIKRKSALKFPTKILKKVLTTILKHGIMKSFQRNSKQLKKKMQIATGFFGNQIAKTNNKIIKKFFKMKG